VADKADALARAAEARKAKDLDRALFFYVKALKFDPRDADLLATIGAVHQFQDNPKLAVHAYSLALQVNPDHLLALEGRGLILLAHGEDDRAENDLTRAVAQDPAAWRSYNGLGLLADRRGKHEVAIVYYSAALDIQPDSGMLLNNRGYSRMLANDYVMAEVDLVKAAELTGFRKAWINLGVLDAQQSRYDSAVESFSHVLKEFEALNRTAEIAMSNGDYAIAAPLLHRAISLSPSYFPVAEDNLAQLKLMSANGN
jgi:tetratricopeptide (TPR) repeat protein